jgi:antitoxin component of MazEF toxin-antitoxin module
MVKVIKKIGNSKGIILDAGLLELAHLKEGDRLSVTIHESGALTFTPIDHPVINAEEAGGSATDMIARNSELFRRLS